MIALKAWIIKYKFYVLAAIIIMAGGFYYYFPEPPGQEINQKLIKTDNTLPSESDEKIQEENTKQTVAKKEDIIVDVKGEINLPGVYPSNQGERVIDVIQRAGGLTERADKSQVNFAAHVQDEMVIYIPAIGETNTATGTPSTSPVVLSSPTGKASGKININKASESELENLPGIGPSKAAAIIQYRQEKGAFQTVEDLKNITGIGDKTFEKLKDAVSVK
jgi:competence protein ComEA